MLKHKYLILVSVIWALLLAVPLFISSSFLLHLLILIFLYALLAGAWNILGGYTGQISLGHAVFFGVGAYASTLGQAHFGLNPWLGMLAGGLIAVVISLMMGYPTFRLRGHYFVIATIAMGEIVFALFTNWEWAGGAVGQHLAFVSSSLVNFQFAHKMPYYYIALGFLSLQLAVTYWLERSYLGYYFQAIREDQDAARALGIGITRYKLVAMGFSAFFMALGGSFYAQYVLYIDPDSVLPMMLSIQVCLIAILGGVGTISGPVIGAAIMIPLAEFSRALLGGSGAALDLIFYGLLIMLIAVFKPSGIMGLITHK
jgi:branched-chain amino acid transport system permease protein